MSGIGSTVRALRDSNSGGGACVAQGHGAGSAEVTASRESKLAAAWEDGWAQDGSGSESGRRVPS